MAKVWSFFEKDTHVGMLQEEYLKIAREEGFEIVLTVPFTQDGKDNLIILFHAKEGILLCLDVSDECVSKGCFYYNWLPNDENHSHRFTQGGRLMEGADGKWFWKGDNQCTDKLRAQLSDLRNNGSFITPWKIQPFLWLLHQRRDVEQPCYDSNEYKVLNKSRIEQLPEDVKKAIRPEGFDF